MDKIEELKEKVEKDPSSKLFVPLAEEYRKAGMLDEAITVLQEGIERQPKYTSAVVALGKIYLQKDMFAEAGKEFEKVIAQVPHNLFAQRKLADVYKKLGQRERAVEQYRRVLKLNPMDEDAQSILEELSKAQAAEAATESSSEVEEEASTEGVTEEAPMEEVPAEDEGTFLELDDDAVGGELETGEKLTPLEEIKAEQEFSEAFDEEAAPVGEVPEVFEDAAPADIFPETFEAKAALPDIFPDTIERKAASSEIFPKAGEEKSTEEIAEGFEDAAEEEEFLEAMEEDTPLEDLVEAATEAAAILEETESKDEVTEVLEEGADPGENIAEALEEEEFLEALEEAASLEEPTEAGEEALEIQEETSPAEEVDMEEVSETGDVEEVLEEAASTEGVIEMEGEAAVVSEEVAPVEEAEETSEETGTEEGIAEETGFGDLQEIASEEEPTVGKAEECTAQGQYNKAADIYREILARDPQNMKAKQGLQELESLLKLVSTEKEVIIGRLEAFLQAIMKRKDELHRNT